MLRKAIAAAAAVAAALGAASAVDAAPKAPPPAIAQYVEDVPTAEGGTRAASTKRAPLPKAAAVAIARDGGSDEATLKDVASSAGYGAPTKPLRPPTRKATAPSPRPSSATAVGAAIGATGGQGSRVVELIVFLVLSAGAVAAVAVRRRSTRVR